MAPAAKIQWRPAKSLQRLRGRIEANLIYLLWLSAANLDCYYRAVPVSVFTPFFSFCHLQIIMCSSRLSSRHCVEEWTLVDGVPTLDASPTRRYERRVSPMSYLLEVWSLEKGAKNSKISRARNASRDATETGGVGGQEAPKKRRSERMKTWYTRRHS